MSFEWHNTWRDSLEIGEAFGRILFVIIDGMLNNPKKESQMKTLLLKLKNLANELEPLYKKDESNNELHSYVQMLERAISVISVRRKIFGV